MPNYQLRRDIGRNFGAMLGAYFGQMSAKRSREQLGADAESLREIADKSLSTDNPITPEDYASRLSKLYAHHGVRRDEGFQADVGAYASQLGRRESAAFAKELYPDRPTPELPGAINTPADYGRLKRWDERVIDTGTENRDQARMRSLMSRFSPSQQFGYYTGQQNAEAAAKAKTEADAASWTKFFLNLNKPKPDEMVTIYGPEGATKQVPVPYGKEFVPEKGWSVSKPPTPTEKGPTWDASRGAFVYPEGRVVVPEGLPSREPQEKSNRPFYDSSRGALIYPDGRFETLGGLPEKPAVGATPSNVAEWEFFNKLSPQDQERYLTMKRATQNINLGGTVGQPSMTQPGVLVGEFKKTLTPEKMPENIEAEARAKASGDTSKKFDKSKDLRAQFLTYSKDYLKVRDSYNRVVASAKNPSPAGDLALIFNYMKILDPGSVVRESEFAQAASTGAYGERIKAAISRVVTGERLSDEVRQDFLDRANILYARQEETQNQLIGEYDRLAQQFGLEPSSVIVDLLNKEPAVNAPPAEQQPLLPPGIKYLGAE